MGIFNIAVVFIVIWWLVWFLTLPFGNRPPVEVELGHAASAPSKPRLLIKATITTVLAIVLTAIAVLIIQSDWIDLRV